MKGDFLGLSTMGMIRIALDFAGLTLENLYAIPMDDQETLRCVPAQRCRRHLPVRRPGHAAGEPRGQA
jgi:hypothetical protein